MLLRRVSDDGSMGATADLSGELSKSDAGTAVVATVGAGGVVTVVWMRASDQHVVAVQVPRGQLPGAVIDVSQASVAASSQSSAAADGLGSVHFVWRNGSNSHVTTRTLAPGGMLSPVTDVSVVDGEAALWGTAPSVAVDATGSRHFAYHRNTDCHIMLRSLSSGGVLGSPVDVSQTTDKAVGDTSPAVATAGGNVLLVWHRDGDQADHADDTVFFNFVSGGTTAGTPTQLSATGDVSMMGIGAAGGPDGRFGVTWQGRTSGAVWHRVVSPAGAAAGVPQQLSSAASRGDSAPAIAVGASAGTAVAWTAASDSAVTVTSSAGTYTPPAAPAMPSVTLIRKSVSLRANTVSFKLLCAAALDSRCAGRASLTDAAGKRAWGRTKFSAAPGATVKVKIRINRAARKKLRAGRRLKAHLVVSVDGGAPVGLSIKLRRR